MFDPKLIRNDFPILSREINGKPLVGAQTFEQFQKYIEEALQAVAP